MGEKAANALLLCNCCVMFFLPYLLLCFYDQLVVLKLIFDVNPLLMFSAHYLAATGQNPLDLPVFAKCENCRKTRP